MPEFGALMDALGYLTTARKYQKAADRLLESIQREPETESDLTTLSNPVYSDPLYFLYAHTIELAFKAYLRFHDEDVPKGKAGHDIVGLHARCEALHLQLPGDEFDLYNVVRLLEFENKAHGFRYYTPDVAAVPDAAWTREIVKALIAVVREGIGDGHVFPPPSAMKMRFVLNRPTHRLGR